MHIFDLWILAMNSIYLPVFLWIPRNFWGQNLYSFSIGWPPLSHLICTKCLPKVMHLFEDLSWESIQEIYFAGVSSLEYWRDEANKTLSASRSPIKTKSTEWSIALFPNLSRADYLWLLPQSPWLDLKGGGEWEWRDFTRLW